MRDTQNVYQLVKKQIVVRPYNGILLRKEQTADTSNNRDGCQKHYAKWKKPHIKDYPEERETEHGWQLAQVVEEKETEQRVTRTFWDDGNILYLDYSNGYKTVCLSKFTLVTLYKLYSSEKISQLIMLEDVFYGIS